jgi:hypothetical protein
MGRAENMSYAFGWAFIGIGVLVGIIRLTRLARSRAALKMSAPQARSGAWQDVAACVIPIAAGVGFLGDQAKDYVLVWTTWSAAFAILALTTLLHVRAGRDRVGGPHNARP